MNYDYIVYTETFENGSCERWYYGAYDRHTANEVALELGSGHGIYHCACPIEDAKPLGIRNLPAWV